MVKRYANKYGMVILETVSDFMPISQIEPDENYMFDLETAEWLALITKNKSIQISFRKKNGKFRCYVVIHDSPSTAALAKISLMFYPPGENPGKILEQENKLQTYKEV